MQFESDVEKEDQGNQALDHPSLSNQSKQIKKSRKSSWCHEDDLKLIEYQKQFKCNFQLVAEKFPYKTEEECQRRWETITNKVYLDIYIFY